ncbi:hypothetical protein DPMN_143877 [Dreissena polymorpha]|uniref:Uncharacterized protein n=1 Tax=Dreissena polymorpha TaxID=45954 RepID=A0A9D4GHV3_DREPO|nr:hypothetical protein DPMN_143877 [Dreissena polymorpha]
MYCPDHSQLCCSRCVKLNHRHFLNDKSCDRQTHDGEVITICRSLYFVAGDATKGIISSPLPEKNQYLVSMEEIMRTLPEEGSHHSDVQCKRFATSFATMLLTLVVVYERGSKSLQIRLTRIQYGTGGYSFTLHEQANLRGTGDLISNEIKHKKRLADHDSSMQT